VKTQIRDREGTVPKLARFMQRCDDVGATLAENGSIRKSLDVLVRLGL
jgi:hypothetical protein